MLDLPRSRRKRAERLEEQIAWILGSPRSGSSWLTQMLGGFGSIWPIHEPMIGWYLGPFVADLPGMDPAAISWRHCTLPRFPARHPLAVLLGRVQADVVAEPADLDPRAARGRGYASE